ncbi:centrosomal protein of 44 kDa isoform X1 [Phyllobates terribilis]|uniref:centrosomal protein of 44 kDa isoform X1 n=1 Tax=Phyllobates terribilis TaxID=111132 RepID=UPI003CCB33F3
MTTGDVKGVLRKLEQKLRSLSYPRDVDYSGLVKGDPAASLPIISYTFTGYSAHIAEILVSLDVELAAKSDLRFIDAVYKVLRDVFHYKPVLTKQQFLQCGFPERRIQTVCDIIDCVVKKHKEIVNHKVKLQPVKRIACTKDKCEVFYPEETGVQSSINPEKDNQNKVLVERHTGTDLSPLSGSREAFVSQAEEVSVSDYEEEDPCENEVTKDAQIDLLRAQLAECQEKLSRLDWMEDRLQALETSMKGKIIIDETDWSNLLSRVLLLETDRLLQSKKRDLTSEFTSISEERTSSRMADDVPPGLTIKAGIPENNHQSSGYSSLLSADSSPTAIDVTEDTRGEADGVIVRVHSLTNYCSISASVPIGSMIVTALPSAVRQHYNG